VRDKRRVVRLGKLAGKLARTTDLLDQARLALEIRDLAEAVVVDCVREANDAGRTWRQIGTNLGVPFQTLFRRYGKPYEASDRATSPLESRFCGSRARGSRSIAGRPAAA